MLINEKTSSHLPDSELFTAGVLCINSGQWLPAYSIFKQLVAENKKPAVAVFYNMALCHFFAKEYEQTVYTLNLVSQTLAGSSVFSNQTTHFSTALLGLEYQSNAHYLALTEVSVGLNSAMVKLRIRRLLVDANLEMRNWQEVIRLATLPEMDNCKNVIVAFKIAKTKL